MLFNRSMRQLADENDMYLSQHRLHVGVIRMVSFPMDGVRVCRSDWALPG